MKTFRNSAQFIDEVLRLLSTAAHVSYAHVVPAGHWPYPITVFLTKETLYECSCCTSARMWGLLLPIAFFSNCV